MEITTGNLQILIKTHKFVKLKELCEFLQIDVVFIKNNENVKFRKLRYFFDLNKKIIQEEKSKKDFVNNKNVISFVNQDFIFGSYK